MFGRHTVTVPAIPTDDAALDSGEITGKIRAIGDDVKRHVEASKETERVLLSN